MERETIYDYMLIGTFLIDYYMYVDICRVNSQIVTQLYVKDENEDNLFVLKHEMPGEVMQDMIIYGKENYGKK